MISINPKLQRAFELADGESRQAGRKSIDSLTMTLAVVLEGSSPAAKILAANQVNEKLLRQALDKNQNQAKLYHFKLPGLSAMMSEDLVEAIKQAAAYAEKNRHDSVSTEVLFLLLLPRDTALRQALTQAIGEDKFQAINKALGDHLAKAAEPQDDAYAVDKDGKPVAGGNGKWFKSALEQFTTDLTAQAKDGKLHPMIGREAELTRALQILGRKNKNNPVLIGEPGVGKTAIVEGIAQRIVSGDVPQRLRGKRLLLLDLTAMLAGASLRGSFEERLQKVVEEVKKAGDIILFLDELHTLVGAGAASGSLDAANALKPSLVRGDLSIIGATTLKEYRQHIENKDAALTRRFQQVLVEPPTSEQTMRILQGLKAGYERHHGVHITDNAILETVLLSDRYINDRFQPDKALDLIDEACSRVVILAESKLKAEPVEAADPAAAPAQDQTGDVATALPPPPPRVVAAADVAAMLSIMTGIPLKAINQDESMRLLNLENEMKARVVGQAAAVSALARAVRRARAGMKDPRRPNGAFLFVGPTGVGKTELAKALQHFLSGKEDDIIRLDMSEYMERHSVSRLIGAPPGYVGYDEGGKLTEAVRRKPYSVILLDEVEKAHGDVFNVLLQLLDAGRLTDGQGRTVDFKNTTVIMTSNLGARLIQDALKAKAPPPINEINRVIRSFFSPEFINRLDETIIFNPLDDEHLSVIRGMLLAQMAQRLPRGVTLELSEGANSLILEQGVDMENGARPMRRTISRLLEDPIADLILMGRLEAGDCIVVDEKEKLLHFDVRPRTPAVQNEAHSAEPAPAQQGDEPAARPHPQAESGQTDAGKLLDPAELTAKPPV